MYICEQMVLADLCTTIQEYHSGVMCKGAHEFVLCSICHL